MPTFKTSLVSGLVIIGLWLCYEARQFSTYVVGNNSTEGIAITLGVGGGLMLLLAWVAACRL